MTTDYDMSIHSNPDAAAWAAFFAKTFPAGSAVPDEATMWGWFANAMMAMSDHLRAKGDESALGKWIRAFGHLHAAVAPHAEVNMPDPEAMAREAVEHLRSRSSSGSGEREALRSLLRECAESMEARPEDPGLQTMARAARRALSSAPPSPDSGDRVRALEEAAREALNVLEGDFGHSDAPFFHATSRAMTVLRRAISPQGDAT